MQFFEEDFEEFQVRAGDFSVQGAKGVEIIYKKGGNVVKTTGQVLNIYDIHYNTQLTKVWILTKQ